MTALRAWQRICRSAPRKAVPGYSGNVLGGKSSQKTGADQIEIAPLKEILIWIKHFLSCRVWAFTREYRALSEWLRRLSAIRPGIGPFGRRFPHKLQASVDGWR